MSDCLFCKIRDGVIPSKRVAETEQALAFHDIAPQAPTHVLIIPKKHISSLAELEPEDAPLVGALHLMAQQIARDLHLSNGYRTVFNTGRDGGQQVRHLHLHLLGGRTLTWPPG